MKLIQKEISEHNNNQQLKKFSNIINDKIDIINKFSNWLEKRNKEKRDDVSASCNDFLKILGYLSLAYSWFKTTKVSLNLKDQNKNFYNEKINTANYYFDKILPRINAHYRSATSSDIIMNAKFG